MTFPMSIRSKPCEAVLFSCIIHKSKVHRARIIITFAARGAMRILLTLHHATFQIKADRDDHQGGWTQCLDRLMNHVIRPT